MEQIKEYELEIKRLYKDYMYLLMRNLGICQKYQMDYKTGLYKIDKE